MTGHPPTSPLESTVSSLREQEWNPVAAAACFPRILRARIDSQSFEARLTWLQRRSSLLLVVSGGVPGEESPEALFARFVDFSPFERLALWAARALGAETLLVAREEKPCFFLVENDRALESVEPPASPSAEAPRRQADDLGHWIDLAGGRLGRSLKHTQNDAKRLVEQLLLGWKRLDARSAASDRVSELGFFLERVDEIVCVEWRAPGTGEFIERLLGAAHDLAPAVVAGGYSALERRALARQIDALGEPARKIVDEISLLASGKLATPVLIETLLPSEGDRHASSRLALLEPLDIKKHIETENFFVFKPVELDLESCGAGRVLEAFEQLALRAASERREMFRAGGRQLEMFDADRDIPNDPFDWATRRALRLRGASNDARRRAIAYLIAARAAELHRQPEFRDAPPPKLAHLDALFLD